MDHHEPRIEVMEWWYSPLSKQILSETNKHRGILANLCIVEDGDTLFSKPDISRISINKYEQALWSFAEGLKAWSG